MRCATVLKPVIEGGAAAVVILPGSAGAVKSFHGDDWSQDYNNYKSIQTCDVEADGKAVHADYDYRRTDGVGATFVGQVTDGDGSGNNCATAGRQDPSHAIQRHRSVEEVPFKPDLLGNWQDTGAHG